MRFIRGSSLVVFLTAVLGAADATSSDPAEATLKAKGFVRSGNNYALSDEAPILEGLKTLQQARKQAEREAVQRKAAEGKISANQKVIKDGTKEFKDLEKRLPKIKDVQTHNRLVTRMNALVDKVKEAVASQKDLEEAANKVPSEGKTKFVDALMALAPKVEALNAKYKLLAADPNVKAAADKVIARSNPKVKVGPSPEFQMALDQVTTWRAALDSEAIPMREDHGVYTIEALVNGESLRMMVDTGATHITLPFEVAKKLNAEPGEQDPLVHMKLANGAIIDGKLVTLKSVRVGRFTVDNVTCVVLQEGLSDPPTMLGSSFLSHFVVKLSQSAREMYLTEVTDTKTAASATPASEAGEGK